MKTKITKIATALMILGLANISFATKKVSIANGDWFNPAIWSPVGVPDGLDDTLIINSSVTFTANIDETALGAFIINSGASLKSPGMVDSLVVGPVNFNNNGIIEAGFMHGFTAAGKNSGVIKVSGDIIFLQNFENENGGKVLCRKIIHGIFKNKLGGIMVIDSMLHTPTGTLTNNGNITTYDWTNGVNTVNGTTGKFCIANSFYNAGNISGTIDICDATPNSISDINFGTIASTVTKCMQGPCSITTGISKNNNTIENISIYPNPSNGVFTIDSKRGNTEILIYNIQGEKIFTSKNSSTIIDISSQSTGVYFVQLKYDDVTTNHKIVVNR